jgi:aspartyl-tRNA(Asn)/glutamyl-tRNA(Gln) amidotransferase subunit A
MSNEWYRKTGHAISAAVQAGEVSAEEVTRSFLERIDAVDEKVRAYVEVWYDAALERAAAIDTRLRAGEAVGPLAGVPLGIKDVLCTREGHTTCCSRILQGYRSPFDATCVERLEAAGAVFLGKLNMDEFAMGSSTENSAIQQTRNPWNLQCVPGGSSGGSAAAVAADECAWSLGSDTGGSIRQPASLCGCIGMKPTYGRVSRWGLVAFASSLDQVGPFTKDVRDLAIALNTICGHDRRDSTSAQLAVPDFTRFLRPEVKGLRIGMPKEFFAEGLGAETRELVEKAIGVYESAGAEIVEVSMPHSQYAVAVYYIICTAEASANLARFDGVRYGYRHPDVKDMRDMYIQSRTHGFGPEVQRRIMLGTYVLSSGYYDAYYLKAQKARTLIKRDFEEAFEKCDVIATPTAPTPAFRPGLSMPCGLTEAGLPVGLQLMGRIFDEGRLIQAAHAYEQLRGFTLDHAPVA